MVMNENWMAFYLAIMNENISVDKALRSMGINVQCGISHGEHNKLNFSDEEIEEMIKLRQNKMTYKKIGKMIGVSGQAIYINIKKYTERMKMRL